MTDVVLLKQKIKDSGLKDQVFYQKLDISRSAWHKKKNGQSPFKVEEIQTVCDLLRITSLREKEHIFFANM